MIKHGYRTNGNKIKEFKSSYEAGFDCGLHGPNSFNSHYKWFSSKESMKEWENGKRDAEKKNAKTKS